MFLCALALHPWARAADLQSWNAVDFGLFTNKRVRWSAVATVRLRDHLHSAYDNYVSSMVRVALNGRWSVAAGYLYRQVNPNHTSLRPEHRLIAAPSVLLLRSKTRLETVFQFERLKPIDNAPSYNRYRPRVVLERVRPGLSPFLSVEGMFFKEQFQRSRNMAGARYHFGTGSMMELGYQFEIIRSGAAWIPRHAIRTNLVLGDLHHLRHYAD